MEQQTMKVHNIPTNMLIAACATLSPYVPELSPTSLVAALRSHDVNPRQHHPKLLNKHEAAELLGVSWWSIVSWAKKGKIPAVHVGAQWKFDEAVLLAHMSGTVNQ
jgi:excisionase family DNA binding protein